MSEVTGELSTALADRYRIERQGERARVVSRMAVLALGSDHIEVTDRHPTDGRLLRWFIAGAEVAPAPPRLILIVNDGAVGRDRTVWREISGSMSTRSRAPDSVTISRRPANTQSVKMRDEPPPTRANPGGGR